MSERNKTIRLSDEDRLWLQHRLPSRSCLKSIESCVGNVIHHDMMDCLPIMPWGSIDLLILDPPYQERNEPTYARWFERMIAGTLPLLKRTASFYVCADWRTSMVIGPILDRYAKVRNRITWDRGKGRGIQNNFRMNSEDVWFCTMSDSYRFQADQVMHRKVAPATYAGFERIRDVTPSNLWNDITVPFWAMDENTDHPWQKSEKMIAKMVLASSSPGDVVFDPFLGSGTTAVVCQKLKRRWIGIEKDIRRCLVALKRLDRIEDDEIQGYVDGVFWERNTGGEQEKAMTRRKGLLKGEDLDPIQVFRDKMNENRKGGLQ